MCKHFFIYIFLGLFGYSVAAKADTSLMIERSVDSDIDLNFPNEDHIHPSNSDFKVVNYTLMSNELGERWAVVTLKNTASGNRIFEKKHLLALFANGDYIHPKTEKHAFEGKEIQTLTLFFGINKFPILKIYTQLN